MRYCAACNHKPGLHAGTFESCSQCGSTAWAWTDPTVSTPTHDWRLTDVDRRFLKSIRVSSEIDRTQGELA